MKLRSFYYEQRNKKKWKETKIVTCELGMKKLVRGTAVRKVPSREHQMRLDKARNPSWKLFNTSSGLEGCSSQCFKLGTCLPNEL